MAQYSRMATSEDIAALSSNAGHYARINGGVASTGSSSNAGHYARINGGAAPANNRPCETVVDSETGYNKVVCKPNPTCTDACVNTLKTKVAAIDAKVAAAEVTKLAEVSAALSKSLSTKRAAYNEYTAADIASVNECNGKC